MKALIRPDSSLKCGTGHLIRCMALAEALKARGVDVQFWVPNSEAAGRKLIESKGVSWVSDPVRADVGVIDHYEIDVREEVRLRALADRILVLDDLANRPHNCDWLLDPWIHESPFSRYNGLLNSEASPLLGPHYAILRGAFATQRKKCSRSWDGPVRKIAVMFGGMDEANGTEKAVKSILPLADEHDLELVAIVGAGYRHLGSLKDLIAVNPRFHVIQDTPEVEKLMSWADVAVCAGGTSTLERFCLGLPGIVLSVAENQEEVSSSLAKFGLQVYLGKLETLEDQDLRDAIEQVIKDPSEIRKMAQRAMAFVDGEGAQRVCRALLGEIIQTSNELRVRDVCLSDESTLLGWRNDPLTREFSLQRDEVTTEQHKQWFTESLANPNRRFRIFEGSGRPAGVVRVDRDQKTGISELSWTVAPEMRGCGVGKQMVLMTACETPGRLLARVKVDHGASIRIALEAGMVPSRRSAEVFEFEREMTRE